MWRHVKLSNRSSPEIHFACCLGAEEPERRTNIHCLHQRHDYTQYQRNEPILTLCINVTITHSTRETNQHSHLAPTSPLHTEPEKRTNIHTLHQRYHYIQNQKDEPNIPIRHQRHHYTQNQRNEPTFTLGINVTTTHRTRETNQLSHSASLSPLYTEPEKRTNIYTLHQRHHCTQNQRNEPTFPFGTNVTTIHRTSKTNQHSHSASTSPLYTELEKRTNIHTRHQRHHCTQN